MESSSCIDSSSSSSTEPTPSPAPPLRRMGSGGSAVTTEAGVEAESKGKLPSSQYKGVVPQPNGRWGAQIYEKHQRVWLGTFNLERDAARAYDVAAQRFRGRDATTNFPPLSAAAGPDASHELAFLLSRSKAEVVDMLRKHTYPDELRHSLRRSPVISASRAVCTVATEKPEREHLFDKAVTPSDVGKLNRLVIPKQHAEKHFPLPLSGEEEASTGGAKGVLLNFEDGGGKVWRFRYSYWNSSQSYVLTKGWSRFVKEKGLMAGDTVGFYRAKGAESHLYIECRPRADSARVGDGGRSVILPMHQAGQVQMVIRLFGVNIVKAPAVSTVAGELNENAKRSSFQTVEAGWLKRQCVGALGRL